MFPLGSVLLPGELLPLRVFEPRYRAMIERCLAAERPEFGVVLIARGREVGGGDVRTDVGVRARIVRVAPGVHDNLSVVAVGAGRIAVDEWLADDPFPQAIVHDWPDPDAGSATVAAYGGRIRTVLARAVELGEVRRDVVDHLVDDAGEWPVWQTISLLPLGPQDRFDLLAAATEVERVNLLDRLLADVDQIQRFRLGLPNMDP